MKIEVGFRIRVRREPQILQIVDSDGTVTELEADTTTAPTVVGFVPNGEEGTDEG